jgi:hypothetical protein
MRALVVSFIIALSSIVCVGCGRHIDAIETHPSPDGAIIAASATNAGDFVFEAQADEIRLYPRGGKLQDGEVILAYGEDETPPIFKWKTAEFLEIQLPCGWWSDLTNHYQLRGTARIITIFYDPPPTICPKGLTSSTSLPTTQR